MKNKILIFLFCLSIVLLSSLYAQNNSIKQDYYPLNTGSWWSYKVVETGEEFLIKVTDVKKFNGIDCYRVVTEIGGKPVLADYILKTPEGVFQIGSSYFKNNKEITSIIYNPYKKILHVPLRIEDTWFYTGKETDAAHSVQTRKAIKVEEVKAPAGTFETVRVNISTVNDGDAEKISNKVSWYAEGVGTVKALARTLQGPRNIVLTKYFIK
ncbi:MAG: hypothetical protein ABIH00_11415 [Armatimonadota bacterium]